MHLLPYIGLALGLVVFSLLLVWQGVTEIIQLLTSSGWAMLLMPIVWLPSLLPTTEAWRKLFKVSNKPQFMPALAAIWMGRAVNNLLPVATIGGEVVKARLIMLSGYSGTDASASVLVDKTVQVLAVIVWGLIGVGLLLYMSIDNDLALISLLGLILLTIAVIGFLLVQKAGLFNILARLGAKLLKSDAWEGLTSNALEVDDIVRTIYQQRTQFFISVLLKSLGLILQTTEVWFACYLLGHPITLVEALMLKSLTSALSDIAFIIPNAYGIQEGAYIVLGTLLGFSPDFSLAVSLATRIRELLVDIPGLLAWQFIESKFWLHRRATE